TTRALGFGENGRALLGTAARELTKGHIRRRGVIEQIQVASDRLGQEVAPDQFDGELVDDEITVHHHTLNPGASSGVVRARRASDGPYAIRMSRTARATHGRQRSKMAGTCSAPDIAIEKPGNPGAGARERHTVSTRFTK